MSVLAGGILIGLVGPYAFNKTSDFVLGKLKKSSFVKRLEEDFEWWASELPAKLQPVTMGSFFRPRPDADHGPAAEIVYRRFKERLIPTEDELQAALVERWTWIRESADVTDLVPFFELDAADAAVQLAKLAHRLRLACAAEQDMFQRTLIAEATENVSGNHEIEIKLALEKLDTPEFREGGGVLTDKRRFHFEKLHPDTRFRLLRGLGFFHALLNRNAASARSFREAARECPKEARGAACQVRALMVEERAEEAHREVRAQVDAHPDNLELLAIRIQLSDESDTTEELVNAAPPGAPHDANVLAALALLALANGDRTAALEYGSKAIDAGCVRPSNYLTMGNALLHEYERPEPWTLDVVADEDSKARIRRAIEYFEAGIENTTGAPAEAPITTQLLTNKADALAFLGDPGVGDWLRYARERLPESPEIRRGYALWLGNNGALDEAIGLLRSVVDETQSAKALLELGVHLEQKGDDASLQDAANVALQVLSEPTGLDEWQRASALRLAVTTLLRAGKHAQARIQLDAADEAQRNEVALLEVEYARVAIGDDAGRAQAVKAAETLAGTLPAWDATTLARRLLDAGEFEPALRVILGVPEKVRTEALTRYAVYCGARSGDESGTLERARAYRSKFGFDADVLHLELDALDGSPDQAEALISEYLGSHPDDRLAWLRRSWLGIREARLEWVDTDLQRMPKPTECHPRNGRVAAQVLAEVGESAKALNYAFRLFRAHFESGEAREALLDVIYKTSAPPSLTSPEIVDVDCAVTLQDDFGNEFSVILESGASPSQYRDEYAPDSSLAKELVGRRIGDLVTLPSLGAGRRDARISAINDKHAYWARRILRPPVGAVDVPGAMRPLQLGRTTEEMVDALRQLLAANRDDTLAVMNAYRKEAAVSIHGVATRLGRTAFEMVSQVLDSSDDVLKTPGEQLTLPASVCSVGVVVDEAAAASLVSIDAHEFLAVLSRNLILSPAFAADLRRLPGLPRLTREHSWVSLDGRGEIVVNTVTREQLKSASADAASMSSWFLKNCETKPAIRTGMKFAPKESLECLFGRSALQAIDIAKETGAVLLSDDLALAMLAKTESVSTITTLDVLRWLEKAGVLVGDELLRRRLQLFGDGYLGVSVRSAAILRAAALASWDVESPPLRDCFRFLYNRHHNSAGRTAMALALILGAFRLAPNENTRRNVVGMSLWLVDVLGVGDSSFTGLVNMSRAALPDSALPELDSIVRDRAHIVRDSARSGKIIIPR